MQTILNYSRAAVGVYDGVAQTKPWDCGPASAQIILQAAGVLRSEDWLISQIGTTTAGTNHAGLIIPVLNQLLPGSGYKVVWLTRDPPSKTQVEQLWKDVTRSIDANRGVILNFEAPPWNYPRGSNGSTSPEYRGGATIYHYVAGMGYAVDDSGGRHIWIADPGFRPFGYFCTVEQVAGLIVPHAYAFAADAPVQVKKKDETKQPLDRLDRLWMEWTAIEFGDQTAVAALVGAASSGDDRAKTALAHLEQVNPAALRAFLATKG